MKRVWVLAELTVAEGSVWSGMSHVQQKRKCSHTRIRRGQE